MSDIIEQILGFTIFSAFILSALADIILAAIWAKIYFTWGLVLFSRYISVELHHSNIPSTSLLNNKLYSFWMGGFIFRELDINQYGFRRKFFSFTLRPMMHGLLIFDTESNRVIVKGYLDWFMMVFTAMWLIGAPLVWLIGGAPMTGDSFLVIVGVMAFYGLITGILYLMDYFRLVTITSVAAELWARKYVGSP